MPRCTNCSDTINNASKRWPRLCAGCGHDASERIARVRNVVWYWCDEPHPSRLLYFTDFVYLVAYWPVKRPINRCYLIECGAAL